MKHFKKLPALLIAVITLLSIAVLAMTGCAKPTLKSISVDSTNAKTSYQYGDEFDSEGLSVTAKMSDGETYQVELSECTFEGFDSSHAGEVPVTVSYGGKSTYYYVTVTVTKDHLLDGLEKDTNLASNFLQEGRNIINKYNPARTKEVVFYGASNFAYWKDAMEEDLLPYKVQNHAFGGSSDKDLVAYAPYLLYPYDPSFVFFQTGSNDYVQSQKPTDAEKIQEAMDYKKQMFSTFHEKLPDATFVVMAGILLPGRAQYLDMTKEINRQLKEYCESQDYLRFVDSEAMTYDENGGFKNDLFVSDKIHLTAEARILWAEQYILPELAAIDAPCYDESEIPVKTEVSISSVSLESISGVPTLTVSGVAKNVQSLRLRLGLSTSDLYLKDITVGQDGSYTVVCNLNEFAENNSKKLTEKGTYNVTIQHDITDTGANTNNRTLAKRTDIVKGANDTVKGEKYNFKFSFWTSGSDQIAAISPSSWYHDDVSATLTEKSGKPVLTVNGVLGNASEIGLFINDETVSATVNDGAFTAEYDLSALVSADIAYPIALYSKSAALKAEDVDYDSSASVVIDGKTYSFTVSNGTLAVCFASPQISDKVELAFGDKQGIPYITVSGDTSEREVWVKIGAVTQKATVSGINYSAEINVINTLFLPGMPEAVKISYDGITYGNVAVTNAQYDVEDKGVYSNGQHRNEYVFVNNNGGVAVNFSQIYSVLNNKTSSYVDIVTVTKAYIGEEGALGRVIAEGTYNTEFVSAIAGSATDGGTAKPGGANKTGLEEGQFCRYWSFMESVLNASMGRPDSNVICNIAYTSKDTEAFASGSFLLMDAQSAVADDARSYEEYYSSQTVNDFSKNVYSYCSTKYFYYGDHGTLYVRYLTNVAEQQVYVQLNETTGKPELVLKGYLGTATKAQLHIANGTNGATPGTNPPSDSRAFSNIVTGGIRDEFTMVADISEIKVASSNSLRIYNNADGDDNMARYYNVKPQYFTTSQTDPGSSVEYDGFIYSVTNVNNYLRLDVKAVTA